MKTSTSQRLCFISDRKPAPTVLQRPMILHSHCRGRQLADPWRKAPAAPLKGELLSVAKLRGFTLCLTNKPLCLTFVRHLPFQGRQGCFAPGNGGRLRASPTWRVPMCNRSKIRSAGKSKQELQNRSSCFDTAKAYKPGSVLTAIYLAPQLPVGSSRLLGTVGRTYCPSTALLRDRVYIVKPMLPWAGCALTAPFHPYPAWQGGISLLHLS